MIDPIRVIAVRGKYRLVCQAARYFVQSLDASISWRRLRLPLIPANYDAVAINQFNAWYDALATKRNGQFDENTKSPVRTFETEEAFLQAVRQLAHLRGWQTWHIRNSRGSDSGMPDLLLRRDECEMWIELKLENRQPSAEQCEFLEWCHRPGWEAHLFRPSDWELIEQTLTRRRVGG